MRHDGKQRIQHTASGHGNADRAHHRLCAHVHKKLGPGFLENIYCRALNIELELARIEVERERSLTIEYRGHKIGAGRVDLIVGGQVIVEVKAVTHLDPVFEAQLLSYLRATRLRAGLLINFNGALLKQGIKRIVL
jgi:GxxExxY protein